jgi:hypothetical protein
MRQTVQHSYVQPLCRRGADDGTYSPWWSAGVKNWEIESKGIVFNLNDFSSNLSTKGIRHSKDKLGCYVRYTTDKSV